ncbi:CPBP family intramembrane glutamic endopeptidase [Corynebacterium cystitidis]|uniref:CAAX prenyl protease 2/Lysostaphin resistance protein A-like domain-containing protein n=1 Tax=Corynebacterium cystitidis DSM 20524 TaxID=1121357 RepID=A0A1H9V033_9CORY|nr:CPBP family intramembrane glutamic endopeptidase [Corynebacterium cystitidis]WJY83628.1 CAAX amino terminal protease self- immunity [Corynebacterium cystitidis DSM 20524]SES14643.1 hypothetical protein SAMN05661109_02008 [Corynebacterium cystitidis DSM 20524]SNV91656.1 CAAX amino terminal protease [Corynebacterium cystitidis]
MTKETHETSTPGRHTVAGNLRPLTLSDALFIFSVAILGGLLVFIIALGAVRAGADKHTALSLVILLLTVHGLMVLGVQAWWLRRRRISWQQLGLRRPTPRLLHLLWQIPVLLVSIALINMGFFVLTGRAESPDDAPNSDGWLANIGPDFFHPAMWAMVLLLITLLVPLWEEVLLRGVLYQSLRNRGWHLSLVILVSSLVFAIMHLAPPLLPYYLALGIGLGLLRAFHDNLWAPFIAHATLNFLVSGTVILALVGSV